jgi:hypothetical protein
MYKEQLFYHWFCFILKQSLTLIKEYTLLLPKDDMFRVCLDIIGAKFMEKKDNAT